MRWSINNPATEVRADFGEYKKKSVLIPENVYAKLNHWVDKAKGEVSGMGEVQVDGDTYVVTDVYLLKQRSTASDTHLSAEALVDLRVELDQQGKGQEGLKLWWHSHADMNTFWSQTDTETQAMLVSDVDWMLSIVLNKKRSIRACIDYRKAGLTIKADDLPVFVETGGVKEKELLDKEFDAKVTETGWGGGYGAKWQTRTDLSNRPVYAQNYGYDISKLQWWDREKQFWVDGEPPRKQGRPPSDTDHPNYLHTHGPGARRYQGWAEDTAVYSRNYYNEGYGYDTKRITDLSTPASKGELFFENLEGKERRAVTKFCDEQEPMCLPSTECGNCSGKGYSFWVRRLSANICLDCIIQETDKARGKGIAFRAIVPSILAGKRKYGKQDGSVSTESPDLPDTIKQGED
jgi:proteasome lid subunit RPN8/RPN11